MKIGSIVTLNPNIYFAKTCEDYGYGIITEIDYSSNLINVEFHSTNRQLELFHIQNVVEII